MVRGGLASSPGEDERKNKNRHEGDSHDYEGSMVHATGNGSKTHSTGSPKEAKIQTHPPNQDSKKSKRDGAECGEQPRFQNAEKHGRDHSSMPRLARTLRTEPRTSRSEEHSYSPMGLDSPSNASNEPDVTNGVFQGHMGAQWAGSSGLRPR